MYFLKYNNTKVEKYQWNWEINKKSISIIHRKWYNCGKCIAVIHRTNDNDDKLVVVPEGENYTDEEISELTNFQEQYFESEIIRKT